jgi:hypothetical protein
MMNREKRFRLQSFRLPYYRAFQLSLTVSVLPVQTFLSLPPFGTGVEPPGGCGAYKQARGADRPALHALCLSLCPLCPLWQKKIKNKNGD